MAHSLKLFTREQRIFLALWRKAVREPGRTVRIELSNQSLALSAKVGLYRAIRPFREEKFFDDELRKACEAFVVVVKAIPETTKWSVELLERKLLGELDALMAEIGIDEEDLLLPEERVQLERLNTFISDPLALPKIEPIEAAVLGERDADQTPFY